MPTHLKLYFRAFLFFLVVPCLATAQNHIPVSTNHGLTLLVFSGSDWCLPCIRFEEKVLHDSTFIRFAQGKLHILEADFPQKKKLADSIVERNDALAEKYNPYGLFPRVLLLDEKGAVLKILNTNITSPSEFIDQIGTLLRMPLKEYRRKELLMGSSFEFILVNDDPAKAERLLSESIKLVKQLEGQISEWIDSSQVSVLNRSAGNTAVELDSNVYELIRRSLAISEITQGAFDITFKGVDLYRFDKEEHASFPDSARIREALQNVSYQNVALLPPNKVKLQKAGMAVGFGAIGKGTAADMVKEYLQSQGIRSGLVSASGDLTAWGSRADGTPWKVGIADPDNPYEALLWLPVRDQAVATSGNYEKYFTYRGKRYAHIINPKNGFPVTDKKSVTVISRSAELSDALATAAFVLDIPVALDLIRQLPGVECIIIDHEDQQHFSSDLKLIE